MSIRIKIGLILSGLFALTILLKHFFFRSINDQGFLINASTEIFGAIITLLIVDKLIKDEEQRKQERLVIAACKSLKNPLRRYINMWLHISNSNEDDLTDELTNTDSLKDYLLSEAFIQKVQLRSFNERYTETSIFGSHDDRTLREQVPKMHQQFTSDIDKIIGNYSHAFDPDTIELLQHFAENAHLYGTFHFGQIANIGENRWFQFQKTENIREHLNSLMTLVEKYNSSVSPAEKWTKDNILRLTKISGDVPNVKW